MTQTERKVVDTLKDSMVKETVNGEEVIINKVKDLCKDMSNMVDNLTFHPEEVLNEISIDSIAKGYFNEIALYWIAQLKKDMMSKNFDMRNESAAIKGTILSQLNSINDDGYYDKNLADTSKLSVEEIMEDSRYFIPEKIVAYFSREHRQTKQNFSDMIFCYLEKYSRPGIMDEINAAYESGLLQ